jgi:hypothetical protein
LELWNTDEDVILKLACEIVGSNLSREQWKETFPLEKEYQRTCPQWPEGRDKPIVIPVG